MRKLLVTWLTLSLFAASFLSGAMPMRAVAAPTIAAADMATMDCEHHAPKPDRKAQGHADLSCCIGGHCPMLGQGLMPPDDARQPSHMGSPVRPIALSLHRGIADSPHLRPPRVFL